MTLERNDHRQPVLSRRELQSRVISQTGPGHLRLGKNAGPVRVLPEQKAAKTHPATDPIATRNPSRAYRFCIVATQVGPQPS